MKGISLLVLSLVSAGLVASSTFTGPGFCSEPEKPKPPSTKLEPVPLPSPVTEGGRPLLSVLRDRKSSRTFRSERLPLPVLSNLLWAAFVAV